MTCDDAAPLLSAALDGALLPAEEVELNQHLYRCAPCRARHARLRAAQRVFRQLAPQAGRRTARRRPGLPPTAAAAAGIAAALLLLFALWLRSPNPAPGNVNDALVFMPFHPPSTAHADAPCFHASDCGVEAVPQMP